MPKPDCPKGKIRNPLTGRCIKTDGVTAKKLVDVPLAARLKAMKAIKQKKAPAPTKTQPPSPSPKRKLTDLSDDVLAHIMKKLSPKQRVVASLVSKDVQRVSSKEHLTTKALPKHARATLERVILRELGDASKINVKYSAAKTKQYTSLKKTQTGLVKDLKKAIKPYLAATPLPKSAAFTLYGKKESILSLKIYRYENHAPTLVEMILKLTPTDKITIGVNKNGVYIGFNKPQKNIEESLLCIFAMMDLMRQVFKVSKSTPINELVFTDEVCCSPMILKRVGFLNEMTKHFKIQKIYFQIWDVRCYEPSKTILRENKKKYTFPITVRIPFA
jgi:hypothetical protein